jgi:hypothetical protein
MIAAAAKLQPIASEEIFRERCEARAILCEACVFDLHEAVDVLQADAERTGLVAEIGPDAVQAILAKAFAAVRVEVDEVPALDDDKTDVHERIAASTIAAAEFLIQQNDPARFKAWLAKHSADERAAIIKHMRGKR